MPRKGWRVPKANPEGYTCEECGNNVWITFWGKCFSCMWPERRHKGQEGRPGRWERDKDID